MGSSWSGFQPQNEIVRLEWAVLEARRLLVPEAATYAALAKSLIRQWSATEGPSEDVASASTEDAESL